MLILASLSLVVVVLLTAFSKWTERNPEHLATIAFFKYITPIRTGIAVFLLAFISGHLIIGPTVCKDGWASPSIGKNGACSHHGGVDSGPAVGVFLGSIIAAFASFGYISNIQSRHSSKFNFKIHETKNQSTDIAFEATPNCPSCGSQMQKRFAKKGWNKGNQFWGCTRFPICKGTRTLQSSNIGSS